MPATIDDTDDECGDDTQGGDQQAGAEVEGGTQAGKPKKKGAASGANPDPASTLAHVEALRNKSQVRNNALGVSMVAT